MKTALEHPFRLIGERKEMQKKDKKLIPILLLAMAAAPLCAFAESQAVGKWKTIDDKTHKAKSVVEISEASDGSLSGKIVELLDSSIPPNCDKCKGELKGKPKEGLRILWGLKPDGENQWSDGNALDPESGKVYGGSAKLVDGGKKLQLRGYIKGLKFLGRSQTWEKQ